MRGRIVRCHAIGRVIRKPDFVEGDRHAAMRALGDVGCDGIIGYRGGGIEQREDALRRGHGLLQRVELVAQVLQRLEESTHQLQECGDRAHREQAGVHALRRRHDQAGQGHGREDLDRGEVGGVVSDGPDVRIEVIAVQRIEPRRLAGFATEQLHHAHAGDAFLREGVDARKLAADLAVCDAHLLLEDAAREPDERHGAERCEGQAPVGEQHHDGHRGQREHVAKPRDDTGSEQFVQRFHVAGHARDEATGRVAVKIADAQRLQLREQFRAQVAHHPLAEQPGEHRLAIAAEKLHQQRCGECDGREADEAKVTRGNCAVDDALREPGAHDGGGTLERQQQHRANDEGGVRAHIMKKATQEPPVEDRLHRIVVRRNRKSCHCPG